MIAQTCNSTTKETGAEYLRSCLEDKAKQEVVTQWYQSTDWQTSVLGSFATIYTHTQEGNLAIVEDIFSCLNLKTEATFTAT